MPYDWYGWSAFFSLGYLGFSDITDALDKRWTPVEPARLEDGRIIAVRVDDARTSIRAAKLKLQGNIFLGDTAGPEAVSWILTVFGGGIRMDSDGNAASRNIGSGDVAGSTVFLGLSLDGYLGTLTDDECLYAKDARKPLTNPVPLCRTNELTGGISFQILFGFKAFPSL